MADNKLALLILFLPLMYGILAFAFSVAALRCLWHLGSFLRDKLQ
jgi:hypothetical protein